MGFTRSTEDIRVHQKLSDYPRVEDGISAAELKARFDLPGITVQTDLNRLIKELELDTASSNIGAKALAEGDTSEANIQAKLIYVLNQIQNVTLGAIPDGSIIKTKLEESFANMIAEKTGTLQKGLNTEKLNGVNLAQLYLNAKYHEMSLGVSEQPVEFTSSLLPAMTSTEQDGFKVSKTKYFDKSNSTYEEIGKSEEREVTIECPNFVKIKNLKIKLEKSSSYSRTDYTLNIFGSNDKITYNPVASFANIEDKTEEIYEQSFDIESGYYKYFKIEIICENPMDVYEIDINNGYTVTSLDINYLDVAQSLEAYEDGLRVSVKMPSDYENNNLVAKMRIGELEYKELPADLKANEYVRLIYNGTSFVREV